MGGPVVTVGPGQQESNLTDALAAIGDEGTLILYQWIYDEALTISAGTVAFLANDGDMVEWRQTSGGGVPQLRTEEMATVLLDGLELSLNASLSEPAIRAITFSRVWADRSIVARNPGGAIVTVNNSQAVLRNCFIGGEVDAVVMDVRGESNVSAQYTTIGAGAGEAIAVECTGGATMTASDSVILTRGMEDVSCAGFSADHTVANMMQVGSDNVAVGATDVSWFVDYTSGDFHLTDLGQMTFMEIAQWNEGDPLDDPLVDIDGMPRAGVEGAMEYPGADLP
ncbi:MAG: hypothetical protein AAGF11_42570 [Myxococcota bacterium]